MIYLDQAATSLIKPPSVEYAVVRAMRTMASPGRGGYEPAMRAAETVFRCRETAAEMFRLPGPDRVVFTANATHGLNLAIRTLVKPGDPVVISGFEHNSVTRPLHALGARVRVAGRRLFDPKDTWEDFRKMLPGAACAVCTCVSNAFGYLLPFTEIAALCRREGVPLILDASQAAGVLELDMERLGAAFMAMPGHKSLFGPQGTGLLLCGMNAEPLLYGGSGSDSLDQSMPAYLPDRLEAGTHNVCGIAGLLAGLEYVRAKGTEQILRTERELLLQCREELSSTELELFAGDPAAQCGVLSLRSRRFDAETLAARLAERGVCVRSGLHCAPLAHESAGTLASGTVRLSFSPMLDASQISRACAVIRQAAERSEGPLS